MVELWQENKSEVNKTLSLMGSRIKMEARNLWTMHFGGLHAVLLLIQLTHNILSLKYLTLIISLEGRIKKNKLSLLLDATTN